MSTVNSNITPVDSATAAPRRGVPRLEQPKPVDEGAAKLLKLRKATNDFEAIFIAKLLKPLAKSASTISSEGSQLGGNVMLEVATEKMAESLAGKGGLGLGDLLFESLKYRLPAFEPPADGGNPDMMPLPADQNETTVLPMPESPAPRPLETEQAAPRDDS
jgi:Rod binding domain-containing protein